MKTATNRLIILNIGESFFTAWAFMKAGRMEPGNILAGVIFLLAFFFYRNISIRLSVKHFAYEKKCGGPQQFWLFCLRSSICWWIIPITLKH